MPTNIRLFVSSTRLPAGHPEGYLEAFALLYREVIADLRRLAHDQPTRGGYPTVHDGLRGMRFIAAAAGWTYDGARLPPLNEH